MTGIDRLIEYYEKELERLVIERKNAVEEGNWHDVHFISGSRVQVSSFIEDLKNLK